MSLTLVDGIPFIKNNNRLYKEERLDSMGPTHKFIVTDRVSITFDELKRDKALLTNNIALLESSDAVKGYFTIGDDLIQFIQGTLYWIPTKNLTKRDEKYDGLCNYGRTKIDGEALEIFAKLLKNWIVLFKSAPEDICLINGYQFYLKEWEHYEKYTYQRADVLASLEKALGYVSFAIDNNYIIIHSGI